MPSTSPLGGMIELINSLKDKINKYGDRYEKNEMLTRYSLIDPFLRALGWDTENPEQVEPEFGIDGGRPDYALKINGKVVAFVEAKCLNKQWDENKLITYANTEGVEYIIATDGNLWKVYDVFKRAKIKDKIVASWDIKNDNAVEIALESLVIANLHEEEAFGKVIQHPAFTHKEAKEESLRMKSEEDNVKCPYCGYEANIKDFKLVKNPWKFRFHEVKVLECPSCHKAFKYYYGISPKTGKISKYTIPKGRP